MNKSIPVVLFASLTLLVIGCSNEETAKTSLDSRFTDDTTSQVAPMAPKPAGRPGANVAGNTGRVLSTLDVPGYTYMEIETDGKCLWIAGSPMKVKEGETVSWDTSTVMRNFYSRTLERTFDEVIFVSRVSTGTSAPASAAPVARPKRAAPIPIVKQTSQGSVVSAQNAANYTYLEVKTADDSVIWLAAPETPVNVNDTVVWQPGSLMTNFKSSSLGKTFPEIYFVAAVQVKN